jgi:GntR family transcriptional regulator
MRKPAAPSPPAFYRDMASGVPVYRQIIDQILGGIASGALSPGDQLPTVRQLAVELAVNPNTVVRAYRELEIRGVLSTQQGVGTFITTLPVKPGDAERQRQLDQLVGSLMARAGSAGFTADDLIDRINEFVADQRRQS